MNDQEIRVYQMFVRVKAYTTEHDEDFPAQSLGREKIVVLEQAIADLDRHGADEASRASAAQVHTRSKRELRKALREQMKAISQTARRMAESMPNIGSGFRIPRTNGDQALINAARGFVTDATPLKAEFIKWEMPANFLETLSATIAEFEEAVNNKNVSTSRRVEATAAIDGAIKKGKQAVRDLDRIVNNKYRNDSAKLAAWKNASHTERQPRSSKAAEHSRPTCHDIKRKWVKEINQDLLRNDAEA